MNRENHPGVPEAMRMVGWEAWRRAVPGMGIVMVAAVMTGCDDHEEPRPTAAATRAAESTSTRAATATPTIDWTKPGPDVTPLPGATPDTSQPWWFVPWENADRMKPYFEGELAGIHVSTAPYERPPPPCADPRYLDAPNDYSLSFRYLPDAMLRTDTSYPPTAVWCGDLLVLAEASFSYAPFTEESPRGGSIRVLRYRGEPVAQLWIREHRVTEGEVGGHPAVLGLPILDEVALGDTAVVVYDGEYITHVEAHGIRMAEVLRIAEGLFPPR